jgi:hypothetical protein
MQYLAAPFTWCVSLITWKSFARKHLCPLERKIIGSVKKTFVEQKGVSLLRGNQDTILGSYDFYCTDKQQYNRVSDVLTKTHWIHSDHHRVACLTNPHHPMIWSFPPPPQYAECQQQLISQARVRMQWVRGEGRGNVRCDTRVNPLPHCIFDPRTAVARHRHQK